MMQFYGALVLMVTLSAASGLRCYACPGPNQPCSDPPVVTCSDPKADRCSHVNNDGIIAKSCWFSDQCSGSIDCCKGDLCNGDGPAESSAVTTGSRVFFLLVSTSFITIFL
ncbi:uncharacterized protein V6R79_026375 [Siganus canaliculatus]